MNTLLSDVALGLFLIGIDSTGYLDSLAVADARRRLAQGAPEPDWTEAHRILVAQELRSLDDEALDTLQGLAEDAVHGDHGDLAAALEALVIDEKWDRDEAESRASNGGMFYDEDEDEDGTVSVASEWDDEDILDWDDTFADTFDYRDDSF